MLTDDKEILAHFVREYSLDEVIKELAHISLERADEYVDLQMSETAKRWSSCCSELEQVLPKLKSIWKIKR